MRERDGSFVLAVFLEDVVQHGNHSSGTMGLCAVFAYCLILIDVEMSLLGVAIDSHTKYLNISQGGKSYGTKLSGIMWQGCTLAEVKGVTIVVCLWIFLVSFSGSLDAVIIKCSLFLSLFNRFSDITG